MPRHSKELRASELSWLLRYNDHRLMMASQSGPRLSAPAEIILHPHDNNLTACAAENSIGRNFFSVCETEQALFNTKDISAIDTHSRRNSVKEVGMVEETPSSVLPECSIPRLILPLGTFSALSSYGECGVNLLNPCKDSLPLKYASLRIWPSAADQKAPIILAPYLMEWSGFVHQAFPIHERWSKRRC